MANEQQRPETGPLEFEGDWPGVFIRGDNAFGYALALEMLIADESPQHRQMALMNLNGLAELLRSCDTRNLDPEDLQKLAPFTECQRAGVE